MENFVKKVIRIAQNKRMPYHEGHAYTASLFLKTVESERGPLPKQSFHECNDYAIDILGDKKYAPWLYVYSAVAGQFKYGWIPANFYEPQVIPNTNGHYGACATLKPLNNLFFQATEFPDLGSFVNGLFFDTSYNVYSSKNFKDMIFRNCDRVIFKADQTLRGEGIHFFDKASFNAEHFNNLGNGVFQRYVDQHPVLSEYTPNSVATIRITTAINDEGKVSARGSYLRVGAKNDTHVQSATAIMVPVDLDTGMLNDLGYLPDWSTTHSHPGSRKKYAGVTLPNYRQCVDAVISLHLKVPFVRCIGWDVTIDTKGEVVILEWNGKHNGIKFTEATQGPSFTDMGWERFR